MVCATGQEQPYFPDPNEPVQSDVRFGSGTADLA